MMEGFSMGQVLLSLIALIKSSGSMPVATDIEIAEDYSDSVYAVALEQTDIEIENGRFGDEDELVGAGYLEHCKALSYHALAALPVEHVRELSVLSFFYKPGERRGFATGDRIMMRCQSMSDSEFVGVFIHEMAHIVDLGLFEGNPAFGESGFVDAGVPIYEDDLSLEFYRISWEDESTHRPGVVAEDFVSEYAATNPFEDFAESYIFYVLNGDQFRKLAKTNHSLALKYVFMRDKVFGGVESDYSDFAVNEATREYDMTSLPFDMTAFFKGINGGNKDN